ncbi:hypothetical protein GALMADRAFT_77866, partial [Galerina marginata CBS 339.88]
RSEVSYFFPFYPAHAMSIKNSATTTETDFDDASQLRELDEAVLLTRQAPELQTPAHPLHSESLDNLANAFTTRFQKGGQSADLDEAISLHRKALKLRPSPNPLRPDSLNYLSKVLLLRSRQEGQPSDLDEAISLPKQALELQSLTDPLRPSSLHNLALALFRQFDITGQKCDLDESISLHRQALELRVSPHPLQSESLDCLGLALWRRSQEEGHQSDISEAIQLYRRALELRVSPHPLRSRSIHGLALALGERFEQDGHRGDLDEAFWLHKQNSEFYPPSHPLRSHHLNSLAVMLRKIFMHGGDQSDLDKSISLQRQALEISPKSSQSMCLNNLAMGLWGRFEQNGRQVDLDEAILLQRQALELLESAPRRSMLLSNLAIALGTRYRQRGHQNDLDEVILLHRQALELRPSLHPLQYMSLSTLATALGTRFQQGYYQSDLDEAILLHRQALELQPSPHPGRSESLNNLANALHTNFMQKAHQTDLNEAILLHREALDIRNLFHPRRSESLNNLANALRTQFERNGQQTVLNEAILLNRKALELRPSPHPDQSQSLYDLGSGLIHAYSLSGNNSEYLEEGIESFRAATQCLNQPASLRLRIAHAWISQAVLHQHNSSIDAYDAALQALPNLAALSFDIKSRQVALLTDSNGLASNASRFAIQAGKIDKAIEFLEAGRAIFWSQFLSLRSPFEELQDCAPELAEKLRDTASALELGSHRNTYASENGKKLVIDQETARLNRLNEVWLKAIDDVRQLNHFEDFLRPRSLSTLQVAASDGPVVILVGNDDGSDILILTSANVHTLHLSGLPNQELRNFVHLIRHASLNSRRSHIEDHSGNTAEFPPSMVETFRNWARLKEERGMRLQGQKDSDTVFQFVLETLWHEVVKPIIDILNLKTSAEPPVVQWCPTGLFSFLPIHAAGCYDNSPAIDCTSEYLISSYTPTIGALLTQDQTVSTKPFEMMVVIQSQELPATQKELEMIKQHVSDDFLVKLGIPGESASVESVASRLSGLAIVHFSCHGIQDRSNPLDSGLKLEDGLLRVSRIMQEKIQNGALAFLCACETAMGDDKLPDEAMSLGASLLFSGFRHVVATMWAMMDEDGPVVADAFYEELFRDPDGKPAPEPDTSKSAYALHLAIKKLRAKNVSFNRWVPFIHMGK